jgi:hypothetical protein
MKTADALHPVDKINELVQAVTTADVSFEIWRLLTFKNTNVETAPHARAFGAYRGFFIPSVHAHLIACVMAIYRLFDSDSGVVSLSACNDLRRRLTSDQNEVFRQKLGSVRDIADRVAGLRNQLFAHRDDSSVQAAFDRARLKRDELRQLINTARELVELLRSGWDLPERMWPETEGAAQDSIRLLDDLGA